MAFDVTEAAISGRGTRESHYAQLLANASHLKQGSPDFVWLPDHSIHPSAPAATVVTRNNHKLLAFDDTTEERVYIHGVMPESYSGGALTVGIFWCAATATSGTVQWETAIQRIEEDVDDIDGINPSTPVQNGTAAPSVAGYINPNGHTHAAGTPVDNITGGDAFVIRVRRLAADAGDTMVGDAQILRITLRESSTGTAGGWDDTDNAALGDALEHDHWQQIFDNVEQLRGGNPYAVAIEPVMQLPASNPAQRTTRGVYPILAFDDTTQEDAYVSGYMPESWMQDQRDGTILRFDVDLWWAAATATTGTVVWNVALEVWGRFVGGFDSRTDLDFDGFTPNATVNSGTASAAGELIRSRHRLSITNANDQFLKLGTGIRLRIRRVAADASDTLVGDAQIARVVYGQMQG